MDFLVRFVSCRSLWIDVLQWRNQWGWCWLENDGRCRRRRRSWKRADWVDEFGRCVVNSRSGESEVGWNCIVFTGLTHSGSTLQSPDIHYGGVSAQSPPGNEAPMQVLYSIALLVANFVVWWSCQHLGESYDNSRNDQPEIFFYHSRLHALESLLHICLSGLVLVEELHVVSPTPAFYCSFSFSSWLGMRNGLLHCCIGMTIFHISCSGDPRLMTVASE